MTITQMALLLSCLQTKAQGTPSVPDVPPSPQAVAFNRLGDYQVNNNYGAPDISIPLFEIDHHGFKIPLTLHYEASPMKSGYNYDVTGWGWTLSGNSCVSRTIKDRADEYKGPFNHPFELDPFTNSSGQELRYMDYSSQLDQLNYQYDQYNIVLPSGRSIPFYMYKSGGVMHYERIPSDSHVKIECSYSTNSIDAFTVTDESGVIYHFTLSEKASNILQNDFNAQRNVTWLLTSIDIPNKETIYYEYTPLKIINTNIVSEPVIRVSRLMSFEQDDEKGIHVSCTFQAQSPRYEMRFLSRISYGPTVVDFNYTNDGLHMSEIVVSDGSETVRRFTLGISGSTLTSLVISSPNNTESLSYGFSYTNTNPGDRTDYWGNRCNSNAVADLGNFNLYFDNVGIVRTTLQSQLASNGNLAQLIENKPTDLSAYYKIKLQSTTIGDTRQPTSPQFHGVLTSITYPNGGHTYFSWENHRFLTATAADGDFVFDKRSRRIIEGGGFRIASITNYTADGAVASEDHYRYGFTLSDIMHRNFPLPLPDNLVINNSTDTLNHHIGCGEAVVDPNLFTFMSYSYSPQGTPSGFLQMIAGQHSNFESIPTIGGPWWWDAYFSANTFRSLLGGRHPVVYPEITVYHKHPYEFADCKSKTVYKYDIYSSQINYISSVIQTTIPDTAYFEPLNYNINGSVLRSQECPSMRHQLKSKSDFSYNSTDGRWHLVSEESYTYSGDELPISGNIFDSTVSRGHCGRHTLQSGSGRLLTSFSLFEFYKHNTQLLGRFTLTGKSTTTLRQGGTRTLDNMQSEEYLNLYPGVLKSKDYHVLPYGIRKDFNDILDKTIENSYVGENGVTLFVGQEDPSSLADTLAVVLAAMRSNNMLASMASTETFTIIPDVIMDSGTKINYNFFGNKILPYKIYESNGEQYEGSVMILSYDSYGNPTEILDLKTGVYSVYLWDIYGRYLIAMIKDATLSQIQNITQLRAASSQTRHSMLQTTFPNALVQTWDYKPLVGVSSHTDVNGQTFLYEYDGLGRLKTEKRVVNGVQSPEILHQYEYNYLN